MNQTEHMQMMSHIALLGRTRVHSAQHQAISEEDSGRSVTSGKDVSTEPGRVLSPGVENGLSVSVYVGNDDVHVRTIEMTPEEKEKYLNILSERRYYSQSVEEQNKKTKDYYIAYARCLEKPAFPITARLGAGFLAYLADTKRYCYNTLATVTYESLLRLNKEHPEGGEVSLEVREAMREQLRQIRVREDVKPSRGGMEPIILDDLKRIIMRINDCD